jgi:PAS domain S-box-containing protein
VTDGPAVPIARAVDLAPQKVAEEVIEVAGRRWKVTVGPSMAGPATRVGSTALLLAGGLASGVLALLVLHLMSRDAIARRHAIRMTRDLQEREVQLRRTEDFLSRLIEVMPSPVMVKDSQFRYLIVNRAAARLFGLPAEHLLGRTVADFLPAEFAERQLNEDREVLTTGADSMREDLLLRPGAEPMPIVVRKTRLDGVAGQPVMVTVVTDLTDERQARAELETAHATTRSILTAIPDVLVQFDKELRFVSHHAGDPLDLTYPPERFLGRSIDEVMSPARAAQYRQAAARAKAGEGPQIMEYASWDGARQAQDYEARLVALETGGCLTVIRRITDRKVAEAALRESEARWQFALEGAGDGVWDWDLVAGRIYRSRRWFALLGVEQDAGWHPVDDWLGAIHPDDRSRTRELTDALKQGLTDRYINEYRIRHQDGSWRWFLARGRAMERDAEGRALRVMGTTADMSERKRVEWALRESEERFRRIADTAPVLIWMASPAGCITYVNRTWADFVGASAETAMGDGASEMIHPEDRSHLPWRPHDQTQREAFSGEFRMRRADGEYRWIQAQGEPRVDGLGNLVGYIGICTDITDQKRAEWALRTHRDQLAALVAEQTRDLIQAKEVAEAASEAKSLFLTNMSHELRTPLHAVLSYAKMGESKADRVPLERLKAYFDRIHTSGSHLLELLNDLLDLAKLEAGKMVLEARSLDLEAVVRESAREFEALFVSRHVTLRVDCETGTPHGFGDAVRVGQVVRNLLSNAVKFAPADSLVSVRLSAATLPTGQGGCDVPAVRLEVADRGLGIPEAELESVFDKFVQSSKTRSGAGGTGLGLSICREIVEAHRGTIRASNRQEGGALLEVLLPVPEDGEYPHKRSISGSHWQDGWIREAQE